MIKKFLAGYPTLILYLTWAIALISAMISLFFSEILKFPPCVLCWYQRIFMYPLVFIVPIGIILHDKKIYAYTLTLSLIGLFIAAYHSLIYHSIIPEALKICTAELSCKTKQFELFNFISIPLMSFLSFLLIFILNLIGAQHDKRN
jgi:disulfide bond formation protein DsbB